MRTVIFFIAIFCISYSYSQSPIIEWTKCFGGTLFDSSGSLLPTADGGYLIKGTTDSNDGDISGNHGNNDIWIAKLSSSWDIEWQNCFGGSFYESASSAIETVDGGYLIAGQTNSNDGDVSGFHGGTDDIWIFKLSSVGDLEWQKCLGGTNEETARSIFKTLDGGYIVSGVTRSLDGDVSCDLGREDYWIVKLSNTGTLEWQRCLGGSDEDYLKSMIPTTDGGYFVIGYTKSYDGDVTGNHGNGDMWVVKLSASAEIEWQKSIGGTGNDFGYSALETSNGGFILAGRTTSNDGDVSGNHGSMDGWVVKLSNTGDIDWQKCYGGTVIDQFYYIALAADGGYILAGATYSNDGDVAGNHGYYDSWVIKITETGDLIWQKCLGGSDGDTARGILQTPDGGVLVTNLTGSEDGDVSCSHGYDDIWIVKLSSTLGTSDFSSEESITMYPNPVTDKLNIKVNKSYGNHPYTIYSITGEIVQKGEIQTNNTTIDVVSLSKGIYFIQIGNTEVLRFIKN